MILGYFADNFPFVFLATGLLLLIYVNKNNVDKELNKHMIISIICLFVLSAAVYMDQYFQAAGIYDVRRKICAIAGYILRPTIFMFMIRITVTNKKKLRYLWALDIFNAIVMMFALVSDKVFYYENNVFHRGIWGYMVYVVMVVYSVAFLISAFMYYNVRRFEETSVVVFFSVFTVIGGVIEQISPLSDNQWLVISFTIANVLYYSNMHMHASKVDSLTGALNRQYFESFIKRRDRHIKAAVSLDLNFLKKINDTQGHEAGDVAIRTVAGIFNDGLRRKDELFRTGGDEFIVISESSHEYVLRENISEMKRRIEEAGYSCAAGYAMRNPGESLEELIKRSDTKMYEDKKQMKAVRTQ